MTTRDPDVSLTRHAPERGAAAPDVLPAGCCCCCCCLHTLGGIAGAVVGSATQIHRPPPQDGADPEYDLDLRRDVYEEDQPLVPPVLLYWLMVALSVFVTVAVTAFNMGDPFNGGNVGEMAAAGLGISIMIFPALQLAASLVSVVAVAIFYPEKSYSMRRLGRITLFWFAGALAGSLLMAGCFGLLSGGRF